MAEQGYDVTYLPVASNGLVSVQAIKDAIRPETCLVSIMAVNNEIGVIQPLEQIGQMLRDLQKDRGGSKVIFHTDAAQAVGKIPMDVDRMGIDVLSISGHKLYGPKGIGAAYIRRRPRVRLEPLMHGGGQERGLRSGTVPAVLAVGLGEACRIAEREMQVRVRFVLSCTAFKGYTAVMLASHLARKRMGDLWMYFILHRHLLWLSVRNSMSLLNFNLCADSLFPCS